MKRSSLLVVVLVVLTAVFLMLRFGTGGRGGDDPLFQDFAPDEAALLNVVTADTTTVLQRVDDVWFVTSEDSLAAEAGSVERLLEIMTRFSRKDIISSNPEKYGLYKVDSTGVWVAVSDAHGDTLVRFVVGKPGPDYGSTYVRDAASGDVILAPGYLRSMFDKGNRSWQDRTVFAFEPDDLTEIGIRRPGGEVGLSKDETGRWFISSPESAGCDENRIMRLTRTLGYLRSDAFAGRMPVPASGLERPDSSVGFRTIDGIREELLLGNHRDDGRVFAKRADSDIVYLLAARKVDAMLPSLAELRLADEVAEEAVEGEEGR